MLGIAGGGEGMVEGSAGLREPVEGHQLQVGLPTYLKCKLPEEGRDRWQSGDAAGGVTGPGHRMHMHGEGHSQQDIMITHVTV